MNPIGLLILVFLVYVISTGTRRSALVAAMAGVLYLTQGQGFDFLGIHFFAIRLLGIVLFARVIARHEFSFSKLNRIDHALLLLYGYTAVVYLLRSKLDDLSIVAGAFDAVFCYFAFRGLVRGEEDLRWLLKTLVLLLIPYALLVAFESARGYSAFMFMGGQTGGWERDGATRCMGSFRYPVSLGAFGASLLALYVALWQSKADRQRALLGIAICIWLIWASNSGGSFSAAVAAIGGWTFWYIRKDMRLVRWAIVIGLAILAFVMKAPLWYIITHGPFGGDSWHRAYVIDVAMRNLDKWWFAGMPMVETKSWFPYTVNGGADITNQYIAFGIAAGIGSIILFVFLISRAFGQIGRAMVKLKFEPLRSGNSVFLVWGLGVMTLVHVVSWFGVSYFDQIYVVWFLELAATASITQNVLQKSPSATMRKRPVSGRLEPGQVLTAR